MSDADRNLPELVGELITSVEQLQTQIDDSRGPLRPPTPGQLARFTSEVTIPALVLALKTNVRALRIVQRALRMADGRDPGGNDTPTGRERATALGRATIDRLDGTLSELQSALEGRPPEDEARELLERVQTLQSEIDAQLAADTPERDADTAGESVDVDVDAELRSLKDDVDEDGADEGSNGRS